MGLRAFVFRQDKQQAQFVSVTYWTFEKNKPDLFWLFYGSPKSDERECAEKTKR